MAKYKTLFTFLVLLTFLDSQAQEYRIYINPASEVWLLGSTNVNSFIFKYKETISIDRPVLVNRTNGELKLSGGIIDFKIKAFDSGNSLMNKDFRTMLKEEEHSTIRVELIALKPNWIANNTWREGTVTITVEINKIIRTYTIKCKVEHPGSLLIYGRQNIKLAEFGLEAPTRMMGLVRVNDWVDFDIDLRFSTDR